MPLLSTAQINALVTRVIDGDTFEATWNASQHTIRLEGVDSPEMSQSYGESSKKALERLILNKIVSVSPKGKDHYGRVVATVYYRYLDVGEVLLKEGACWVYPKYNDNPQYPEFESWAKDNRLGLWKEDGPTPPWEFRN